MCDKADHLSSGVHAALGICRVELCSRSHCFAKFNISWGSPDPCPPHALSVKQPAFREKTNLLIVWRHRSVGMAHAMARNHSHSFVVSGRSCNATSGMSRQTLHHLRISLALGRLPTPWTAQLSIDLEDSSTLGRDCEAITCEYTPPSTFK